MGTPFAYRSNKRARKKARRAQRRARAKERNNHFGFNPKVTYTSYVNWTVDTAIGTANRSVWTLDGFNVGTTTASTYFNNAKYLPIMHYYNMKDGLGVATRNDTRPAATAELAGWPAYIDTSTTDTLLDGLFHTKLRKSRKVPLISATGSSHKNDPNVSYLGGDVRLGNEIFLQYSTVKMELWRDPISTDSATIDTQNPTVYLIGLVARPKHHKQKYFWFGGPNWHENAPSVLQPVENTHFGVLSYMDQEAGTSNTNALVSTGYQDCPIKLANPVELIGSDQFERSWYIDGNICDVVFFKTIKISGHPDLQSGPIQVKFNIPWKCYLGYNGITGELKMQNDDPSQQDEHYVQVRTSALRCSEPIFLMWNGTPAQKFTDSANDYERVYASMKWAHHWYDVPSNVTRTEELIKEDET